MAKRRNFTDQFKAKVALEALRGDKLSTGLPTFSQAASRAGRQKRKSKNSMPRSGG